LSKTKRHDDLVRAGTIATLDTAEQMLVQLSSVLREVANGAPLEPQQAGRLAAQRGEMLKHIVATRNNLRLSGSGSTGIH
jgi:hypothetical protein